MTHADTLLFAALISPLLPMVLVPLAALVSDDKKNQQGLIYGAALVSITLSIIIFANLAVDLSPLKISVASHFPHLLAAAVTAGLIASLGAATLARRASNMFEPVVTVTHRFAMLLVFLMAFIQFTVVILRYVFGVNFIFMQESVTYLHGFVFLLAAGFALLSNDHVRVDIFYAGMNTWQKALTDFIGFYLFLAPFCFVTLVMAAPYVANSWAVLEGSTEQSGIQGIFILKTLIPIFATLLLMAGFVTATRAATTLRGEA